MDINQQLQPIITGLITDLKVSMEHELRARVTDEVVQQIARTELNSIINNIVEQTITKKLASYDLAGVSQQKLNEVLASTAGDISKAVLAAANDTISREIKSKLDKIDTVTVVNEVVKAQVNSFMSSLTFPERSISHKSVNFDGMALSGDQIKGGIIEKFGSTGIDDQATFVQLTLMDHATVFEGPVYAPKIHAKGSLVVDGDLIVSGTIPKDSNLYNSLVADTAETTRNSLSTELFKSYSNLIYEEIQEKGLSLNKLMNDGKEVLVDNRLGYHITDSNLQRVGMLVDLQTRGENLLSDTLYVTNKRVGVNTLDPSASLAVWDEECEVIVKKRKQETAYIGTDRRQEVVLGSSGNDNITLQVDGNTVIPKLTVNKIPMTSGASIPNYEGTLGQIVFNERPAQGYHIGWVCLGGARWAGFGRIE